jgi:hypothetical protein
MVDQAGTFAPADLSAGATNVALGDDNGSAAITMGFTFNFFGVDYTDIYIASNGFLAFDNASIGSRFDTNIPSSVTPNAIIAIGWDDLNPTLGGVVRYRLDGTAPNRIFIVEYNNIEHFGGGLGVNAQAMLYEGSNDIELHGTEYTADGPGADSWVQGIENADGTVGLGTPGRNAVS